MPNKRILVVDDEPYVRNVLVMKLKAAGYEVATANNGADGFVEAVEIIPDAVLSDFHMPEMTGLELAQRLKANEATSKIPVIMITSRGDLLTPEQLAKTNIRKLLDKPFSPRQVLSTLNELFGISAAPTPPS